jgi:hypothetical protein
MARSIHNHKIKIQDSQLVSFGRITPGMIITFDYQGLKISDKQPLVFYLYYNRDYGLLEGLNLNYLNNYRFKNLFEGLKTRTSVSDIPDESNNLLSEDYTYIAIPPTTRMQTKSVSEAKKETQRMYKKFVGPKFGDIYRSYYPANMKSIKIVNLRDY